MLGTQTVSGAHTRLLVGVGGTVWNCWSESHVATGEQTRSAEAVAATLSNCALVHTVRLLQTRSLVAVGGDLWYSAAEHAVSAWQTRSIVSAGAET